ncbi:hypothetical protein PLICRDRAFT_148974 [Plicaturopsis crispa FD-325 SS-3]|nr:hypothetical protein PLICRDRAFT_148974 [Plicaturopsis crispa FD-325 SS-3]
MSAINDISGKLGEYMLKGWVLTDTTCPNPGCSIPLMRSPAARSPVVHFCANCDGDPATKNAGSVAPTAPQPIPQPSPSVSSSSVAISRTSTPPTELSSTLSSPTFAPPIDTEESLRRRQQSDAASSEIGKRLLKGWAMLADECPNPRCYGVPLVRPPKAGGGRDPRKECVICSTVYVDERDLDGWDRLVAVGSDGVREEASTSQATGSTPRDKGKAVARDETPQVRKHALPSTSSPLLQETKKPLASVHPAASVIPTLYHPPASSSSTSSALDVSARSLELTLHSLSEKLTFLAGGQTLLDPSAIALTADAISKVTQALTQVKALQWNEGQAGTSL